ncbi:unnamed protein product [Fraxinus pennsylvanica]|uniref:Uncharacterized protein n=1 Tax=Fraxinus pennsylvanica TaxID=56036 RepID=A0AAD1YMV0_9LAMI|nr:unnamed protein product [Fraxinus pennsylvanica]
MSINLLSRSFSTDFSKDPELKEFMEYMDGLKNYEKSDVPKCVGTDSDDGFDLRRMKRLLQLFGNPQSQYKAYMALNDIHPAKESLKKALDLELNDGTSTKEEKTKFKHELIVSDLLCFIVIDIASYDHMRVGVLLHKVLRGVLLAATSLTTFRKSEAQVLLAVTSVLYYFLSFFGNKS